MDHDKQIKQWVQDPKSFFLAEDVSREGEKPSLYILEEEFARTKKNRSYGLYAIIFLVSVLVIGGSFLVGEWYRRQASQMIVDIPEFEDLRLRDILASYARSMDSLSRARFELEALRQEYRDLQGKLRQRRVQEEMLISLQDLTEEARVEKRSVLSNSIQQELRRLEETYLPKIQVKEEEVQRLEAESAQYQEEVKGREGRQPIVRDSTRELYENRMRQQQQHFQRLLADQKRSHERELAELRRYHTRHVQSVVLRYNPVLATPALQEALGHRVEGVPPRAVWPALIRRYQVPFSTESLVRQQQHQDTLLRRLMLIPYTNSVPLALAQVYRFSLGIIGEYEALGVAVSNFLEERDQLWRRAHDGLQRYVRERRENALVLSPRLPALLVFDPVYSVRTGDVGYIFRQDNQRIARVRFIVSNHQTVFADVVEWYDERRQLEVFDRVVLHLRGE